MSGHSENKRKRSSSDEDQYSLCKDNLECYLGASEEEGLKVSNRLEEAVRTIEILQHNLAAAKAEKEDALTRLEEAVRTIEILKHDLTAAKAEKEDALTRLSALMSVKLRDNNPNIDDLSDPNRPTRLAEMFSELYDNEWTDAFTAINIVLSERQTITFLLDIVMDAYSFCSEELHRTWLIVSDCYLDDSLPNNQQIRKLLKDSRKIVVVKMTQRISERYKTHLHSVCAHQKLRDLLSCSGLGNYVTQVVKLCLLMCANDPPVVIECQDNGDNIRVKDKATGEEEELSGVKTASDKVKTVQLINKENANKEEKRGGQEQTNMAAHKLSEGGTNNNEFQNDLEESNNGEQSNDEESIHMEMKQLNEDGTFVEAIQVCEISIEFERKLMVQQRFQRRPFDRKKFKEYTSRGPYLEYIVWPVMYLHQGGPMLTKGVAQGTRMAVGIGEEEYWTWKTSCV